MKRILTGFLFFLFLFAKGQSTGSIDDIKALIPNHREDTQLVNIYVSLSEVYINRSDNDSSIKYAEAGLILSGKIKFAEGVAASTERLGIIELYTAKYYAALSHFKESLSIYTTHRNNSGIASTSNDLALLYQYKGDYDSAMIYCDDAYKFAVLTGNNGLLDAIYNLKGCIYQKKGDFDLATNFFFKALTLAEQTHDSLTYAQVIGNIGLVNSDIGKQDIARSYHFEALKRRLENGQLRETAITYQQLGVCYKRTKQLDSALYFYRLALPISFAVHDTRMTAYLMHNISDVYKTQNNFDSALHYSELAKEKFETINDHLGMIVSLNNRGQLFLRMAKEKKDKRFYQDALTGFKESLKVAESTGSKDWKLKDYDWLSSTYEEIGDYRNALENLKLYADMVDTVYAESKTKQIAEMQTKYETERKDNEINKLNSEKQLSSERLIRQRTAIAGLGLIALLILVSSFLIYKNVQKKRKAESKLAILEKKHAIEGVRSKISIDIHDDVGSGLTKIGLYAQQLMQNEARNEKEKNLLEKISHQSREVITGLREIIWASNPANDNLKSLLGFMHQYIHRFFEDTGIQYAVNFPESASSITLHPEVKRNLFLILKETLNNMLKHSGAGEVNINFESENQNYSFCIRDNGKGIDDKKINEFSNGLKNMKQRAEQINSILNINSLPGSGVEIKVEGKLY